MALLILFPNKQRPTTNKGNTSYYLYFRVSLHTNLILNTKTKHIVRQVIIPAIVFLLGWFLLTTEWSSSYLKKRMVLVGASMCYTVLLWTLIRKIKEVRLMQNHFFKSYFSVGFVGILVMILVIIYWLIRMILNLS